LGGGLSRAATIFLPYLQKEFKKRLTMASAAQVSIRISTLGEKSGILGAAKMAFERFKKERRSLHCAGGLLPVPECTGILF
jgi:glucokinase